MSITTGTYDPNSAPGGSTHASSGVSVSDFTNPGLFIVKQPLVATVNASSTLPPLTRNERSPFPVGKYGVFTVIFTGGSIDAAAVATQINASPIGSILTASRAADGTVNLVSKTTQPLIIQYGIANNDLGFAAGTTGTTIKGTIPETYSVGGKSFNVLLESPNPYGDEQVPVIGQTPPDFAVEYLVLASNEGNLIAVDQQIFHLDFSPGIYQVSDVVTAFTNMGSDIVATTGNGGTLVLTPSDPNSKLQILDLPAPETNNLPNSSFFSLITSSISNNPSAADLLNVAGLDPTGATNNEIRAAAAANQVNAAGAFGFVVDQTTAALGAALTTKAGPFTITKPARLLIAVNYFQTGKIISGCQVQWARNSAIQTRFSFSTTLNRWAIINQSLGKITNGDKTSNTPRLTLPIAPNDFVGTTSFGPRPLDFTININGINFNILPVASASLFGTSNGGSGPNSGQVEFAKLEQSFNFNAGDVTKFSGSNVIYTENIDGTSNIVDEFQATFAGSNLLASDIEQQFNSQVLGVEAFVDSRASALLPGLSSEFADVLLANSYIQLQVPFSNAATLLVEDGSTGIPAIITSQNAGPYKVGGATNIGDVGLTLTLNVNGSTQNVVFTSTTSGATAPYLTAAEVATQINAQAQGVMATTYATPIGTQLTVIAPKTGSYSLNGQQLVIQVGKTGTAQTFNFAASLSTDQVVNQLNLFGSNFVASNQNNALQITVSGAIGQDFLSISGTACSTFGFDNPTNVFVHNERLKLTTIAVAEGTPAELLNGTISLAVGSCTAAAPLGFYIGQLAIGATQLFATQAQESVFSPHPVAIAGSNPGPFNFDNTTLHLNVNGQTVVVPILGSPASIACSTVADYSVLNGQIFYIIVGSTPFYLFVAGIPTGTSNAATFANAFNELTLVQQTQPATDGNVTASSAILFGSGFSSSMVGSTLAVGTTSVAIASNAAYINNITTLNVTSTSGFTSTGDVTVYTSQGLVTVTYTGTTPTSFTGIAPPQTTLTAGGTLPLTSLNVNSTQGFPTQGSIVVQTSSGNQTVTYTNTTSTTFTGVSGWGAGSVSIGYTVTAVLPAGFMLTGDPVTQGANAGYYEITQFIDANHIQVSTTFLSTQSSLLYYVAGPGALQAIVANSKIEFQSYGVGSNPLLVVETPTTTITSDVTLPITPINVKSTNNFPPAGSFFLGGQTVTYTGLTATSFTGCSGGTGTFTGGATVVGDFATPYNTLGISWSVSGTSYPGAGILLTGSNSAPTGSLPNSYAFGVNQHILSLTVVTSIGKTNVSVTFTDGSSPSDTAGSNVLLDYDNTLQTTLTSGGSLPLTTLDVNSTQGFPSSGSLVVQTSSGNQNVTYTGLTSNTFTGVSGWGTGSVSNGYTVTSASLLGIVQQLNAAFQAAKVNVSAQAANGKLQLFTTSTSVQNIIVNTLTPPNDASTDFGLSSSAGTTVTTGGTLPFGTLLVASTSGFPSSNGTINVLTSIGYQTVTYGTTTSTSFQSVTGWVSGTVPSGASVFYGVLPTQSTDSVVTQINDAIQASGICGATVPPLVATNSGGSVSLTLTSKTSPTSLNVQQGSTVFGLSSGASVANNPPSTPPTPQTQQPATDPAVTDAVPTFPAEDTTLYSLQADPYTSLDGTFVKIQSTAGWAAIERNVSIAFAATANPRDKDITAAQVLTNKTIAQKLSTVPFIPLTALPDLTKPISLSYNPVPPVAPNPLVLNQNFAIDTVNRQIKFTTPVTGEVMATPDTTQTAILNSYVKQPPALKTANPSLLINSATIMSQLPGGSLTTLVRDQDYVIDENAGLVEFINPPEIGEVLVDNVLIPDLSFLQQTFTLKVGTGPTPLPDTDIVPFDQFTIVGEAGWILLNKPLTKGQHAEVSYMSLSTDAEVTNEVLRTNSFDPTSTTTTFQVQGNATSTYILNNVILYNGAYMKVVVSSFDSTNLVTNVTLRTVPQPITSAVGGESSFETNSPPIQVSNFIAGGAPPTLFLLGNLTSTYPVGSSYPFNSITLTVASSVFDGTYTELSFTQSLFAIPGSATARYSAGKVLTLNNVFFYVRDAVDFTPPNGGVVVNPTYNNGTLNGGTLEEYTFVVVGSQFGQQFIDPAVQYTIVPVNFTFPSVPYAFNDVPVGYGSITITGQTTLRVGQLLLFKSTDGTDLAVYPISNVQYNSTTNTTTVTLPYNTVENAPASSFTLGNSDVPVPVTGATKIQTKYPLLQSIPIRIDPTTQTVMPLSTRFNGLETEIQVFAGSTLLTEGLDYTLNESGIITLTNVPQVQRAISATNYNVTATYLPRRNITAGEQIEANYVYYSKSFSGVDLLATMTLQAPDAFYVQVQSEATAINNLSQTFQQQVNQANGQVSSGAAPSIPSQPKNSQKGKATNVSRLGTLYDTDYVVEALFTYYNDRVNALEDEWQELSGRLIGGAYGRLTAFDFQIAAFNSSTPTRLFPVGNQIVTQQQMTTAQNIANALGLSSINPSQPTPIPALFGITAGDLNETTIPNSFYYGQADIDFAELLSVFSGTVPTQPFGNLVTMTYADNVRNALILYNDNPIQRPSIAAIAGAVFFGPIGFLAGSILGGLFSLFSGAPPPFYHPLIHFPLVPDKYLRLMNPLLAPGLKLYNLVVTPRGIQSQVGSYFGQNPNGGYEGDGTPTTLLGGLIQEASQIQQEYQLLTYFLNNYQGSATNYVADSNFNALLGTLTMEKDALNQQINSLNRQISALNTLLLQTFEETDAINSPRGFTQNQAQAALLMDQQALSNAQAALTNITTFVNAAVPEPGSPPTFSTIQAAFQNRRLFLSGANSDAIPATPGGRLSQINLKMAFNTLRESQIITTIGYTGDTHPFTPPPDPPIPQPPQTENLYNLRYFWLTQRLDRQQGSLAQYNNALVQRSKNSVIVQNNSSILSSL